MCLTHSLQLVHNGSMGLASSSPPLLAYALSPSRWKIRSKPGACPLLSAAPTVCMPRHPLPSLHTYCFELLSPAGTCPGRNGGRPPLATQRWGLWDLLDW